jgi:hypothetical protein
MRELSRNLAFFLLDRVLGDQFRAKGIIEKLLREAL